MAIHYFDGEIEVRLGDQVEIRVLFRRRRGRIVYVPGISPLHPQFEFNGMRWIAIRTPEMLISTPVLTKTGNLKKKVTFLGRDDSAFDPPPPGGPERDTDYFDN